MAASLLSGGRSVTWYGGMQLVKGMYQCEACSLVGLIPHTISFSLKCILTKSLGP